MHTLRLSQWQHTHEFVKDSTRNEKNTLRVVILTASMMVAEIAGGLIFGSMALLADGIHMGTHAFALGIAVGAYWYARRQARNPSFSFGTGKVSDLGGYTSAVLLLVAAVFMAIESIERLLNPVSIRYSEAILVAGVGLAVNLASAWILRDHHDHDHHHGDEAHDHDHTHNDHNLKAAYLHVLADALTSVLAIVSLVFGKMFGWVWMDAVMGVVGSAVITRWSIGLLKETSGVLLDKNTNSGLAGAIRQHLESEADNRICDLHLWEVGPGAYAAIVSIVTHYPRPVEHYKGLLAELHRLVHVSVEVHACTEPPCVPVSIVDGE